MSNKLKAELKQQKPFSSLAEEALLNLERTADRMRRSMQQALKPHGITLTQFNALRILRGSMPAGLTCSELGDRLVSGDPDITRLLDRMAREGLVRRSRSEKDRRVVLTEISCKGLALLKDLVPQMDEEVRRCMAHMSPAQLHTLIDLLEETRSQCETLPAECSGKTAEEGHAA